MVKTISSTNDFRSAISSDSTLNQDTLGTIPCVQITGYTINVGDYSLVNDDVGTAIEVKYKSEVSTIRTTGGLLFKNCTFVSSSSAVNGLFQNGTYGLGIKLEGGTIQCTMSHAFADNSKVTRIRFKDVSDASTSDGELCSFNRMCYNCTNLESVDFSSSTLNQIKNIDTMFQGCKRLNSVDFSGTEMKEVTTIDEMFKGLTNLRTLNITSWLVDSNNNTKCASAKDFCNGCTWLATVSMNNKTGFANNLMTSMKNLFNGCASLTLDCDVVSTCFKQEKCTNTSYMFKEVKFEGSHGGDLRVAFDQWTSHNAEFRTMEGMFMNTNVRVVGFHSSMWNAVSNDYNVSHLFDGCTNLEYVEWGPGLKLSQAKDMSYMFNGCAHFVLNNCQTPSTFNTSSATNLSHIFDGCTSFPSFDTQNDSGWIVSAANATDVSYMFANCTGCAFIKDTRGTLECANATNIAGFFSGTTLTSIDFTNSTTPLRGIVNGTCKDASELFKGCTSLTTITWKTNVVNAINEAEDVHGLFCDCEVLERNSLKIDGNNCWTFPNASDFSYLFYNCQQLTQTTKIDLPNYGANAANIQSTYGMFYKTQFKEIDIKDKLKASMNMHSMFRGCSVLEQINTDSDKTFDLSTFTINNIDIGYMFYNCELVEKIILPNSSSVATSITGLFYNCRKLETIVNLEKLVLRPEESKTSLQDTFGVCYELKKLIFSPALLPEGIQITSFNNTFGSCKALSIVDNTEGLQTEGVWNLANIGLSFDKTGDCSATFYSCQKVREIVFLDEVQELGPSIVYGAFNMKYMFRNCIELQKLTNFEKIKLKENQNADFENMFSECSNLLTLDLSSLVQSTETNVNYIFSGADNLRYVKFLNINPITHSTIKINSIVSSSSKLMKIDLSGVVFSKCWYGPIHDLFPSGLTYLQEIDVLKSELNYETSTNRYYVSYPIDKHTYEHYYFPYGVQETQDYTENDVAKTRLIYNQIRSTIALLNTIGTLGHLDQIKYIPVDNQGYVTFKVWDKDVHLYTTPPKSIMLFTDLKFKDSSPITFNNENVKTKLEYLITDSHTWDNIGLMFVNCEFEMNNGTNVDLFRTAEYIKNIYFNISRFTGFEASAGGHLFQNDDNLVTFCARDEWYKDTILRDVNGTNSFGPTVTYFFHECSNLLGVWITKESSGKQDSLEDVTDYSDFLSKTPKLKELEFCINKPNVNIDNICDRCGEENDGWDSYNLRIFEDATISSATCAFHNMKTLERYIIDGLFNVLPTCDCISLFDNCQALYSVQFNSTTGQTFGKSLNYAFNKCKSLKTIDLSMFNFSSTAGAISLFYGTSIGDKFEYMLINNDYYDTTTNSIVNGSGSDIYTFADGDVKYTSLDGTTRKVTFTLNVENQEELTGMISSNMTTYDSATHTITMTGVRFVDDGSYSFYGSRSALIQKVDPEPLSNCKIVLDNCRIIASYADTYETSQLFDKMEIPDVTLTNTTLEANTNNLFHHSSSESYMTNLTLTNVSLVEYEGEFSMTRLCTDIPSLKTLTIDGLDIGNLTSLAYAFSNLPSLTDISITNVTCTQLVDINSMFVGDTSLEDANISAFNSTSINNITSLFKDCNSLEQFTLGSNLKTSQITDISQVFYMKNKSGLQLVDLRNIDFPSITTATNFFGIENIYTELCNIVLNSSDYDADNKRIKISGGNYIDLPRKNSIKKVWISGESGEITTVVYAPLISTTSELVQVIGDRETFSASIYYDSSIPAIVFDDVKFRENNSITFKDSNVETELTKLITDSTELSTVTFLFKNCSFQMRSSYGNNVDLFRTASYIKHFELQNTAFTKSGGYLFFAPALTESRALETFKMDAQSSIGSSLECMFSYCQKLTRIDIDYNNHNHDNVSYKSFAQSALELTTVNMPLNGTIDASFMFQSTPITNLDGIHFSGTLSGSAESMFQGITTLETANFTGLQFLGNTDYSNMLHGCTKLTSITFDNTLEHTLGSNIKYMFYDCESLTKLDLSMFTIDGVTSETALDFMKNVITTYFYELDLKPVNYNKSTHSLVSNGSDVYVIPVEHKAVLNVSAAKIRVMYHKYVFNQTDLDLYIQSDEAPFDTTNKSFTFDEYEFMDDGSYSLHASESYLESKTSGTSLSECKLEFNGSRFVSLNGDDSNIFKAVTIPEVILSDSTKIEGTSNRFFGGTNGTDDHITSIKLDDVTTVEYNGTSVLNKMMYGCTALKTLTINLFEANTATEINDFASHCSNLETVTILSFKAQNAESIKNMFAYCSKLTSFVVDNDIDAKNTETLENMFGDCVKLESIDTSKWNISKCTNVQYMFYGCLRLAQINASGFSSTSLIDTSYMFHLCHALTSIDLSKFKDAKIQDAKYMFAGCTSLTTLDFSTWSMNTLTDTSFMFAGDLALETVNFGSNFDTSNITNMESMFDFHPTWMISPDDHYDSKLTYLNLETFNFDNVTNMDNFYRVDTDGYTELREIKYKTIYADVSNTVKKIKYNNKTLSYGLPTGYKSFSNMDESETNYTYIIYRVDIHDTAKLISVINKPIYHKDFITFDVFTNTLKFWETEFYVSSETTVSSITFDNVVKDELQTQILQTGTSWEYITWLFDSCSFSMIDISTTGHNPNDVSLFRTANYIYHFKLKDTVFTGGYGFLFNSPTCELESFEMDANSSIGSSLESLFYACPKLETVNIDYNNVLPTTSFDLMFAYCDKLTSVSMKIGNMESCVRMFIYCEALRNIDNVIFDGVLSGNGKQMFAGCTALKHLDLTGLKINPTNKTTGQNMFHMFDGCSALDWIKFDPSTQYAIGQIDSMFNSCSSLIEIDFSMFDLSYFTSADNFLSNLDTEKFCQLILKSEYYDKDNNQIKNENGARATISMAPVHCKDENPNVRIMFRKTISSQSDLEYAINNDLITYTSGDQTIHIEDFTIKDDGTFSINASETTLKNVFELSDLNDVTVSIKNDHFISLYDTRSTLFQGTTIGSINVDSIRTFGDCEYLIGGATSKTITIYGVSVEQYDGKRAFNHALDGCSLMETLDIQALDITDLSVMTHLFANCSKITEIDLTKLAYTNLTDITGMFMKCSSLLRMPYIDTTNLRVIDDVFNGCSSIQRIDLSSFDFSQIESMTNFFHNHDISIVRISKSDYYEDKYHHTYIKYKDNEMYDFEGTTAKKATIDDKYQFSFKLIPITSTAELVDAINTSGMVYREKLNPIDFFSCQFKMDNDVRFDAATVKEALEQFQIDPDQLTLRFYYCEFITAIDNDYKPFQSNNLYSLVFEGSDLYGYINRAFRNNKTIHDITYRYTTAHKYNYTCTMKEMFRDCSNLVSVDWGDDFTIADGVENMENMFMNCINITTMSFPETFDMTSTTTIRNMFSSCETLEYLDLSKIDFYETCKLSNMLSESFLIQTIKLKTQYVYHSEETKVYGITTNGGSNRYIFAKHSTPESDPGTGVTTFTFADVAVTNDEELKSNIDDKFNVICDDDTQMATFFSYTMEDFQEGNKGFSNSSITAAIGSEMLYLQIHTSTLRNVENLLKSVGRYYDMTLSNVKLEGTSTGLFKDAEFRNINVTRVIIENTTDSMFENNIYLRNVSWTDVDTTNVTNMSKMFKNCQLLTNISINTDTSNVTDMCEMFSGCADLKNLDLSSMDLSNVETGNFAGFIGDENGYNAKMEVLKIRSEFYDNGYIFNDNNQGNNKYQIPIKVIYSYADPDIPNVTVVRFVYPLTQTVSNLEEWKVYLNDPAYTSFIESAKNVIIRCMNFKNFSEAGISSTYVQELIQEKIGSVADVNIIFDHCIFDSNNDGCGVIMNGEFNSLSMQECTVTGTTKNLFKGTTMNAYDIATINYETITNASSMFEGSNIAEIDFNNLNTEFVTEMTAMFKNCDNVKNLDISQFEFDLNNTCSQFLDNDHGERLDSLVIQSKYFNEEHNRINNYYEVRYPIVFTLEQGDNIYVSYKDRIVISNKNDLINEIQKDDNMFIQYNEEEDILEFMGYNFSEYTGLGFSESDVKAIIKAKCDNHMPATFVFTSCRFEKTGTEERFQLFSYKSGIENIVIKKSEIDIEYAYCFLGNYDTISITVINTKYFTDSLKLLCSIDDDLYDESSDLETVDLSGFILTTPIKSMEQLVSNQHNLGTLILPNITDTSQLESINKMCYKCGFLENINIESINFTVLNDMQYAFENCQFINSIKLCGTGVNLNMDSAFTLCRSLETIDLSDFTANIVNMANLMSGANKLEEVDMTTLTLSNANCASAFASCERLKTVYLPSGTMTDASQMFLDCTELRNVDLSPLQFNLLPSNPIDILYGTTRVIYEFIFRTVDYYEDSSIDYPKQGYIVTSDSTDNHYPLPYETYTTIPNGDTIIVRVNDVEEKTIKTFEQLKEAITDNAVYRHGTSGDVGTIVIKACRFDNYLEEGFSSSEIQSMLLSLHSEITSLSDVNFMFDTCTFISESNKYEDESGEGIIPNTTILQNVDYFKKKLTFSASSFQGNMTGLLTGTDVNDVIFKSCNCIENDDEVLSFHKLFAFKTLNSIDLSGLNSTNVKDFSGMFLSTTIINRLDECKLDLTSAIITDEMFKNTSGINKFTYTREITRDIDSDHLETAANMFDGSDYANIDLKNMDFDNVYDISGIIDNTTNETLKWIEIPVENYDIENKGIKYDDDKEYLLNRRIYYEMPVVNGIRVGFAYPDPIDVDDIDDFVNEILSGVYVTFDPETNTITFMSMNLDKLPTGVFGNEDVVRAIMEVTGKNIGDLYFTFENCKFDGTKKPFMASDIEHIEMIESEILNSCSGFFSGAPITDISFSHDTTFDSIAGLFKDARSLETIDLKGIVVNDKSDMSHLFDGCISLYDINLSSLDTSETVNMSYMFAGCSKLEHIDLTQLDTSSAEDLSYLFYCCERLNNVDFSQINLDHATNISHMFNFCTYLTSLDLSTLDTTNITNMNDFINDTYRLKEIRIPADICSYTDTLLFINYNGGQYRVLKQIGNIAEIDGYLIITFGIKEPSADELKHIHDNYKRLTLESALIMLRRRLAKLRRQYKKTIYIPGKITIANEIRNVMNEIDRIVRQLHGECFNGQ